MLKGRRLLAAAALIALASAGHVWFWYWPRERLARFPSYPAAESPAGLLSAAELGAEPEVAIWLPYPHQNLAAWSHGDALRWLETLPGALGDGGWPLLPARELALRWSLARDRGALAARTSVYPLISWLAKASGRVKPATDTGPGAGRVDWRGSRLSWQRDGLEGESSAGDAGSVSLPKSEPVLLAVRLSRPLPPFAAGLYGVRRSAGELELADLEREPPVTAPTSLPGALAASPPVGGEVCLIALRRSSPGEGWEVLALLGPRSNHREVVASGGLQIPSAVVMRTTPGGGFRLPAASLMKRLDLEPRSFESGSWRGLASDRRAAAHAVELAQSMSALLAGDGARLEAALWLEPRPLAQLAQDLVTVLDSSPLAPSAELSRWRLLPLLGELRAVDRVTLLYAEGRGRLFLGPASD